MNEFSISMALVDYIPVALFGVAAVFLQRDLYHMMSKGAFALFAAGTVDVFCAGILKATYKLLYAANLCDFEALSSLFFPLQAIGFLLAGLGIVALLFHKQSSGTSAFALAVPPLYKGTFLFVGFMVAGLAAMDIGFCVLSKKLKKPQLMVFFLLSLICSICMGYLSSRDFTQAYMNWIAQGVNVCGQGMLCIGAFLLHQAGLKELTL